MLRRYRSSPRAGCRRRRAAPVPAPARVVSPTSPPTPRARASTLVVRKEQLLTADFVIGDRLLPVAGSDPADERLTEILLHMRVLGRIHQHDPVLVEESLVALDEDRQVAAVLERQPSAAIGDRVRVHSRRRIERRAHARAGLSVPRILRW